MLHLPEPAENFCFPNSERGTLLRRADDFGAHALLKLYVIDAGPGRCLMKPGQQLHPSCQSTKAKKRAYLA